MRRLMFVSITLLCCSATAYSQQLTKETFTRPQPIPDKWKAYTGPLSVTSSFVCWGGALGDPLSSRGPGFYEMNSWFRNDQGGVRMTRGLIVGSIPCAVSYALEKKHPRAAIIGRFVYGGVKSFFAIRNVYLRRAK